MAKFRKKPIVIEAEQYIEYGVLVKGMCNSKSCYASGNTEPHVHTIHDNQIVRLETGDWIIPEPDGKHYYPVRPEIFADTYDEVCTFKIDKPFAAMSNEEICEGCKFFLPILNHCRLNAPIAGAPSGEKWPWVSNKDSCGQYKRKRV